MLHLMLIALLLTQTDTVRPYRLVTDGPVQVQARLTKIPRLLTIGDRLNLEVVVKHPNNLNVSAPFTENQENFTILDQQHIIRYQGDTLLQAYNFTLAIFGTDTVKLGPFLAAWSDVGGLVAAASDTITIQVKSLISDRMTDINDIKGQVDFPNLLPLWITLGVLGLAIAAFFARRLLHHRRHSLATPPLPPWEEALRALDALPVAEWLRQGQVKRYYYAVSEIVKRYLSRRFGFPAVDQTTTEILRELKTRRLPAAEGFGQFFVSADLVKYAKYTPPQPEHLVVQARELVNQTTPRPEPEDKPAPTGG